MSRFFLLALLFFSSFNLFATRVYFKSSSNNEAFKKASKELQTRYVNNVPVNYEKSHSIEANKKVTIITAKFENEEDANRFIRYCKTLNHQFILYKDDQRITWLKCDQIDQ